MEVGKNFQASELISCYKMHCVKITLKLDHLTLVLKVFLAGHQLPAQSVPLKNLFKAIVCIQPLLNNKSCPQLIALSPMHNLISLLVFSSVSTKVSTVINSNLKK